MKIIEKPGTTDVGEFSPLVTPLETPEVVTTAHTQAPNLNLQPRSEKPSRKVAVNPADTARFAQIMRPS